MPHSRKTLKLTDDWDLCLDGVGRIALTAGEKATAQNVSNEARLFTKDAYFVQAQGLPHFLIELGQRTNPSLLRSYLRQAALKVPDVREVQSVEVGGFKDESRSLNSDIRFSTNEGMKLAKVTTYF